MNRNLSTVAVFCACAAASLAVMAAKTTDSAGRTWYYSKDANDCLTIERSVWRGGYLCYVSAVDPMPEGAFTVPAALPINGTNYPVVAVGPNAFEDGTLITSVVVPSSVKSLGSGAFSGCSAMTSATLPEGYGEIAPYLFSGCSSLASFDIPALVVEIGTNAFSGCSHLPDVAIPKGVKKIGAGAFVRCTSFVNIAIPHGVTEIEEDLFFGCTNLVGVSFSAAVTNVGQSAFRNCFSLTEVSNVENVVYFGESAFENSGWSCERLELADGVVVCDKAFAGCQFDEVVFMGCFNDIGNQAFADCWITEDLYLVGNGRIGAEAFAFNCFERVFFDGGDSDNVGGFIDDTAWTISVGDAAFGGCECLQSVYFNCAISPYYDSDTSLNESYVPYWDDEEIFGPFVETPEGLVVFRVPASYEFQGKGDWADGAYWPSEAPDSGKRKVKTAADVASVRYYGNGGCVRSVSSLPEMDWTSSIDTKCVEIYRRIGSRRGPATVAARFSGEIVTAHNDGWATAANGGAMSTADDTVPEVGLDLYAHWPDGAYSEPTDGKVFFVAHTAIGKPVAKVSVDGVIRDLRLAGSWTNFLAGAPIDASALNAQGKNGIDVWKSYVFGVNPNEEVTADEQVRATIRMGDDGKPVVRCEPDMSEDQYRGDFVRYTVKGKAELDGTDDWPVVTDDNCDSMRFFKVAVDVR